MSLHLIKCPRCGGTRIEPGYGLAGGGGPGPYWFCEDCASIIQKSCDPIELAESPRDSEATRGGNKAPSSEE